jgi:putative transposase
MATDPRKSVPPNQMPESAQSEIDRALASGLGDFSLRELLSLMLSNLGLAERRAYLARNPGDRSNGFYDRSLALGSVPLELRIPRTRSGDFRPTLLPDRYERGYAGETQSLLLGLLASSRSVNATRAALNKMGLSASEEDLDTVAAGLVEELELRNTRPLDSDLLALFIDGKYIEGRHGDRRRPCCLYLAVGLGRDGKKRVLSCVAKFGRENLEDWKTVLRGLVERGLRRVVAVLQDDFAGLLPMVRGLFPQADVQLCIVQMYRNARSHLSKADAAEFEQRLRAIRAAWTEEVGAAQFEDLCDHFADRYPSFVADLRKKRDHYLAFLKYPESVRRSLSSTNAVEAVNGQLEILRPNSGGDFQSEETLKLKVSLALASPESGTRKAATVVAALDQFNALFAARYETEV